MVAIAIRVLAGDIIELYNYQNYLWEIGGLLPIFLAAQAPELVVNDMRQRILPLYFSRPISRFDYVVAKLGALTIGLLALTLFGWFGVTAAFFADATQALAVSCNVTFLTLANELGTEAMQEQAEEFGFNDTQLGTLFGVATSLGLGVSQIGAGR